MPKNHSPEPWKVREYSLISDKPITYFDTNHKCDVTFHTWDIVSGDSPMRVAQVDFRLHPAERVGIDWGPPQTAEQAIANRDRIVACVNACAGMEDPAAEIDDLRQQVAKLSADLTYAQKTATW